MNDDDVLNLMKPGIEYSRDDLCSAANVSGSEDRVFVSRALGRLKRWGKVVKGESGNWMLACDHEQPEQPEQPAGEPEYVLESSITDSGTVKLAADNTQRVVDLNKALLKVESALKPRTVENLDDKIYTLEFLGKLLDPTIDGIFKSIIEDLRQMNN